MGRPLMDLRTQREQIDATMQQERIFAALTAGFGALALVLACVGVYGVTAYSVARRTNEIGVRLALGALPQSVLAMVLGEASWLGLFGVGSGLAIALALTRLVKSLLYGLQPQDPLSLAGGAMLLVFVALAASWIPARRAAGVQPMEALPIASERNIAAHLVQLAQGNRNVDSRHHLTFAHVDYL